VQDIVAKYTDDIQKGVIPAGIHLKNAVARFTNDYKRATEGEDEANSWDFSWDAVEKVVKFIHKLKHFTGESSKKHFDLQPWQLFIVANLYGFFNKDGTRRFQTAYIELGRKNGKTALVAALSLYHLIADGEDGAEVLFAANSLDQAKIGFNMVDGFAMGYDPDETIVRHRYKDIYFDDTNSFIKVLAADSNKLDGYNCSLGVVDEFHSAPDSKVRDVLRSSMGMRKNPMLITITTAGFDKNLPCYELRTVITDILSGTKKDDSIFGVIYSLDDKDDWKDPKNWIKSNPNLDVTVKSSFIEKQVQQAINSPSDEVGVKTKNLNIWCDSATTWIPDEYIIKATRKLKKDDFNGGECFIGADLSTNVDLTAVAYHFLKDDKHYFFVDYYIPIDTLKTKVHADMVYYREWVQKKYLKTTPGNVTDYDYITRDILDMGEKVDIVDVFYDKYNATQWVVQCTEQGLNMTPFGQNIGNFNNCTKEFERLILGGKIIIDDNPITRYCLRNVELRYDFNGNCKPNKESDKKKIDGTIAMLQALAAWIQNTTEYKGTNIF
jgi:phage terminase large subunit-like protein